MLSSDPLPKGKRPQQITRVGDACVPVRLLCCSLRRAKKRRKFWKRKESSVSDAADTPFPPEEICAQARGNAAAWILTIIAYLKERGLAVQDCVAYHGRSF